MAQVINATGTKTTNRKATSVKPLSNQTISPSDTLGSLNQKQYSNEQPEILDLETEMNQQKVENQTARETKAEGAKPDTSFNSTKTENKTSKETKKESKNNDSTIKNNSKKSNKKDAKNTKSEVDTEMDKKTFNSSASGKATPGEKGAGEDIKPENPKFDFDKTRIARSADEAANGEFVPSDSILSEYWGGEGANVEFVLQDNGTYLIMQDGVAMGFTTAEGKANYDALNSLGQVDSEIQEQTPEKPDIKNNKPGILDNIELSDDMEISEDGSEIIQHGKWKDQDVTIHRNKDGTITSIEYEKDGKQIKEEYDIAGQLIQKDSTEGNIVKRTTYKDGKKTTAIIKSEPEALLDDKITGEKHYIKDGQETDEETKEWIAVGTHNGNTAMIHHYPDGTYTVDYTNKYRHIYTYDKDGYLLNKRVTTPNGQIYTEYYNGQVLKEDRTKFEKKYDPTSKIENEPGNIKDIFGTIAGHQKDSDAQQENISQGLSTESAHNEHVRQQTQEKTAQQESIIEGLSTESAHNEHVRQQTQNNAAPQTGYTPGNQNSTPGTPTGSPAETGAAVSPQPGYTPGNQNSTPGTPIGSPAETGAAATQ